MERLRTEIEEILEFNVRSMRVFSLIVFRNCTVETKQTTGRINICTYVASLATNSEPCIVGVKSKTGLSSSSRSWSLKPP